MNLKVSIAVLVALLLQACSSLEVTQSRYGNGIGVSFEKSSKAEEAKVDEFRKRKRDEFLDRNYKVNPKVRGIKRLTLEPIRVEKVKISQEPEPKGAVTQKSETRSVGVEGITDNSNPNDVNTESTPVSEELPKSVEETQGETYNLGYIGVILIIAGLVLLLLGIGQGFAIVVLGVVLIILAYFLG